MASTDNVVSTKPKRRNSEKRKEKSRNAARCRRSKETEIFYELAHQLPMPHSLCAQLDKAGIMRLVLSYLKISKLVPKEVNIKQEITDEDEDSNCSSAVLTMDQVMDSCCQKALEGFAIVLSAEGDIIYLSECVSVYLGLKQTEIMGHSIYEYTHPCDHEEIREQLSSRHMVAPINGSHHKSTQKKRHHHDFLIRFKCTLTPRGKKVNLKSAVYKVIQCSGHVKTVPAETIMGYRFPAMPCLVMVGTPIHHPANIEIPLDGQTFLTRHNMDMKFTYCDDRIEELLGYESKELVGRSFYEFYHALDNASIEKCHRDLFAKGQTRTGCYRFLAKEGGYAWLQTEATVIYSNKTNKPQCVVCVNYCLSAVEEPGLILSKDQIATDTDSGVGVAEDIELSTENVFVPKECLSSDETSSDELLFWLEKGEEQGDQTEDTEDELMHVDQMSVNDSAEPQMFVPFDPFAPLSDDNKLTTIEELAEEVNKAPTPKDGYYSPPTSAVPAKNILTGSNDPLMPDSRPPVNEKPADVGYIPPDDLEMRAPFIPIDDFELGSDANDTPFGNLSDTWMPVDPFGHNGSRVENKPQTVSSPFSPSSLAPSTPPNLATPAESPISSPRPMSLNTTIGSPNYGDICDGGGGGLTSSLNRSLPNLQQVDPSQLMVLLNTPPVNNQFGTRRMAPDNTRMPAPPVQNPPWIGTPVSSPLISPPASRFGTPHSLGSPLQQSNFATQSPMKRTRSDTLPGLMSMLKRKATTGLQNEEPGRKLLKTSVGMPMMSSPQMALQAPLPVNKLLEPQHQVSGVGDDGSFARFLHKFALNVSNQSNDNKVSKPEGNPLLITGQVNPLQQNIDVMKNPDAPPGRVERRDSLPLIDCQDAEVNAPLQSVGGLLQGEELLKALDASINRVPSQTDLQAYQVN